jgi:hypothetical protein
MDDSGFGRGGVVTPKRIQRKRAKGWRLPAGVICVGRGTKWGNPFKAENGITRDLAIALFRQSITPAREEEIRRELRGKTLACWCSEAVRCHGDVLLEIANS